MTYFMVAHRNHVSMFDILRGKWTDMKTFKDTVRYIAVKKRSNKVIHKHQLLSDRDHELN